jgi:hypothetical protein
MVPVRKRFPNWKWNSLFCKNRFCTMTKQEKQVLYYDRTSTRARAVFKIASRRRFTAHEVR